MRRSGLGAKVNWIAYSLLCAILLMTSGCASLRGEVPRVPSHAIVDGDRTTLGQVFSAQAAQHPGLSGFQVIASGHSAFVARAALADAAERTLDLQYFSVGDDLTTDLLLLRLVAAAERGLRVRILLDDIHASARAFARRATAAHPGIEVRVFNPFDFGGESSLLRLGEFFADSERLNRRMHNKLWVTDNVVAIVGSRNLADAYFDANETGKTPCVSATPHAALRLRRRLGHWRAPRMERPPGFLRQPPVSLEIFPARYLPGF